MKTTSICSNLAKCDKVLEIFAWCWIVYNDHFLSGAKRFKSSINVIINIGKLEQVSRWKRNLWKKIKYVFDVDNP